MFPSSIDDEWPTEPEVVRPYGKADMDAVVLGYIVGDPDVKAYLQGR